MRLFAMFLTCLWVGLAVSISAQDKGPAEGPAAKEVRDLGFTAADLDKFEAIVEKYRERITTSRAQIEVLKAQVAKALVPAKPDRPAVLKLIRDSLDVEGELRFAQIERQIDLREVLGEKRWKSFNRALRTFREWAKTDPRGPSTATDPGLVRTFGLVDELVP